MKSKQTSRVAVDDISVGTRMTVLRNRFKVNGAPKGPESDYLKGTVLQVKAISLPYVLVDAFDPIRGRANVSVDVRDHWFSKLDDTYADAVIRGCYETADDDELLE